MSFSLRSEEDSVYLIFIVFLIMPFSAGTKAPSFSYETATISGRSITLLKYPFEIVKLSFSVASAAGFT